MVRELQEKVTFQTNLSLSIWHVVVSCSFCSLYREKEENRLNDQEKQNKTKNFLTDKDS